MSEESYGITVLTGGVGPEREVSIASGTALTEALETDFRVDLIDLQTPSLPEELDPTSTVVFPVIHGTFGEDGVLQSMLEQNGFAYAGSKEEASRLCMDKSLAKKRVSQAGVRVSQDETFLDPSSVDAEKVCSALGDDLIIKPTNQGSSIALFAIRGSEELNEVLIQLEMGSWMIEKRIFGREVTVGLLDGKSMGVVEVIPEGGIYDYERKYSVGATEYCYPAAIDLETEQDLKKEAELAFEVCGCRDFARVDFMISHDGDPYFLEVNTLPGLTSTSLLPKSAACVGYDFNSLAKRLIDPAIDRFQNCIPFLQVK